MSETLVVEEQDSLTTKFLQSINVSYDIGAPERISHYHPTSKTLPLLRSFVLEAEGRNSIVVAPYGSGKSLLATCAGQMLENRPKSYDALKTVLDRIQEIDPSLATELNERIEEPYPEEPRAGGIVIPIAGYQENLGVALCRSLADSLERLGVRTPYIEEFRNFRGELDFALKSIVASKKDLRRDALGDSIDLGKILIVWDEFGRHLEELIAVGNAGRLDEIQLIAEFAARQKLIPISFVTFLHQNLASYVSGLSQSVRNEWKKIEGRFESIQYVDDSAEILRLVCKLVETLRPSSIVIPRELETETLKAIEEIGLFPDMSEAEKKRLLRSSYPLEPAALYMLPRVSARAAQNERTLFSFLYTTDLGKPISPIDVFDYFEETMRTDTGVGGSFHQWHETQNAIEMVADDLSVGILKTAGILGLGISGQRSRVSKEFLNFAASGYRINAEKAEDAIESLIEEKLLLYRKTTDHVAIWYGVDVDLQGRLDQEKARHAYSFDLMEFLQKELPPRTWMPLEYNSEYRISRYFASRYIAISEIKNEIHRAEDELKNGLDGLILHIIPDESGEYQDLIEKVNNENPSNRIVVTAPTKTIPIYDKALEVFALRLMQEDDALVGEDPLVLPELRIMSDDALTDLNRTMRTLTAPTPDGPVWHRCSKQIFIDSPEALRKSLSDICRDEFSQTPKLNNEMVVRKKPRPTIVNARKKLIAAILNANGTETLGLEGFRPDSSMLRTLLIHTGIYRNEGKSWGYADPKELEDSNLRLVWQKFWNLFQEPSSNPKDLKSFFEGLVSKPFGLRPGVFPIFFAAGMVAFGQSTIFLEDDSYIDDLLPSVIESACSNPNSFHLYVYNLSKKDKNYLRSISDTFKGNSDAQRSPDVIRAAYDDIRGWFVSLPPATQKTRKITKKSINLIGLLKKLNNPIKVLFEELPSIFPSADPRFCDVEALSRHVEEIETVIDKYYGAAEITIREALHLKETGSLPQDIRQWTSLIPRSLVKEVSDTRAVALFNRLLMSQDTAHLLIDSVGSLITEKTVNRWDDSSVTEFDRLFRAAVAQIEEHAIVKAKTTDKGIRELTNLAVTRFEHLFEFLVDIVGKEEAKEKVQHMLEEIG